MCIPLPYGRIAYSIKMIEWLACRLWPPSSCQEPQLQSLLHHVQMPQNVPPIPKAVQSEVSIWPAICVRGRVLAVCSKMSQVFFLCAQESPKRKAAKKENFAGHATDVSQRNWSSNTKDTHVTLTHPHGVPWHTVSFRWPLLVVIHWCFAWHSRYYSENLKWKVHVCCRWIWAGWGPGLFLLSEVTCTQFSMLKIVGLMFQQANVMILKNDLFSLTTTVWFLEGFVAKDCTCVLRFAVQMCNRPKQPFRLAWVDACQSAMDDSGRGLVLLWDVDFSVCTGFNRCWYSWGVVTSQSGNVVSHPHAILLNLEMRLARLELTRIRSLAKQSLSWDSWGWSLDLVRLDPPSWTFLQAEASCFSALCPSSGPPAWELCSAGSQQKWQSTAIKATAQQSQIHPSNLYLLIAIHRHSKLWVLIKSHIACIAIQSCPLWLWPKVHMAACWCLSETRVKSLCCTIAAIRWRL